MRNESYEKWIHDLEIKVMMLEKRINLEEATKAQMSDAIARGFSPSRLTLERGYD